MSYGALWRQCKDCALCQGSRYQSPPLLGIFKGNPILVIAQNPGEAKPHRKEHLEAAAKMVEAGQLTYPDTLAHLYMVDFIQSYAYNVGLAQFFGQEWLRHFDYTNAVRCRTPNNELPSFEMLTNCSREYTRKLIKYYDAAIFVGQTARIQFDRTMSPMSTKKGKSGRLYLAIPHYAARGVDVLAVRRKVETFVSRVRSLHESSFEDVEI